MRGARYLFPHNIQHLVETTNGNGEADDPKALPYAQSNVSSPVIIKLTYGDQINAENDTFSIT